MLDPTVLIAAIGGIVTVILAVIGILGTILTGKLNRLDYDQKMASTERKAAEGKTDVKLETIHALANSTLSTANSRLDLAMQEIKGLRALMQEMKAPTAAPAIPAAPTTASGVTTIPAPVMVPK